MYNAFTRDPDGIESHLRLVGGSTVDYFSTEHDELCPEVAGPIDPPLGMTQRFQHPQYRELSEEEYDALPDHSYLEEDQLDNPNAGKIYLGNYTETLLTKEFVPDDDLLPLPHSRTQLCHYALRLSEAEPSQNTAAWSRFKQLVAFGFETEFHFRILHRNEECVVSGLTSWCDPQGADGFAFVVQNDGRKVVGTEVSGLGYGFANSLAVEFDTHRDQSLGDRTGNHISVHVPPTVGDLNTAGQSGEIAYADDIPLLAEGTHVVRIEYTPTEYAWDDLGAGFDADLGAERLSLHAAGRPGMLTVELDGQRVIGVPIDLAYVVQVDGTLSYKEDAPTQLDADGQPNPDAYDELGSSPGRAWVGFTSSTAYFQYQSVFILSWVFTEKAACPGEGAGDTMCRVNEGTAGRTVCSENNTELCSLVVRNIGRQPVQISARHFLDRAFEATPCEHGILQWNQLHPYFLGCSKTVRFTGDLEQLIMNTLDGSRAVIVDDAHTLMKASAPFKKRSIFEWCTLEHYHDPARLYFAQCSCEYCIRLLHLSASYAVYYQHMASERFGLLCPCFEASEVDHDTSTWSSQEPLRHMRLHVSRGCAFTSQCAETLKFSSCEEAYQTYQLGNPQTPTILSNGFEDLVLDDGRVEDGRIRGDACDCTPNARPYVGSGDGGTGQCQEEGVLSTSTQLTLSHCQSACDSDQLCTFYAYWVIAQTCKTYWYCEWELCTDTDCMAAVTYQLAELGEFFNTLGDVLYYNVYPLRTVQTSKEECQSCLHLYEETFCVEQCGPITQVPYLHWPGGPLCATCIFAGNQWHELTDSETTTATECVMESIRNGLDPWSYCNETSMEVLELPSSDLFNGVATHYLSECPGRTFDESGAVCVPNIYANDHFPLQILSRIAAINDTVWSDQMECLNAFCDLVPRSSCYYRLASWDFANSVYEETAGLSATFYNGTSVVDPLALVQGGALTFVKAHEEYVVTSPLPFALENTTIEAWITVGEIERVTNIAQNKTVESSSSWQDDYLALYVVDGDFNTYWQSQIGEVFMYNLQATLIIDLGTTMSAQAFNIYWKQPAADFTFAVSRDNTTFEDIATFLENSDETTLINTFYRGRFLRILMTTAATLRTADPGINCPVYSIWEVEVIFDQVVSTLKPAVETHTWHNLANRAIDGDVLTFWSTPTGVVSSYVLIDFGVELNVNYTIVRWQYTPQEFSVRYGSSACSEGVPAESGELLRRVGTQVESDGENSDPWSGRCLAVLVHEAGTYFNEYYMALSEVEVYNQAINLAYANSTVVYETFPTNETGGHLTAVDGALDGDPTTYWMLVPVDEAAHLLLDLGSVEYVMSIEVRWATVDGLRYSASSYSVSGGTSLPRETFEELDTVVPTDQFALDVSRQFVVAKELRYVVLYVNNILSSNPNGYLGLEDFIIWKRSNNLVIDMESNASASVEWANCDSCSLEFDSETYIHDSSAAVDADYTTWWGAPFAVDPALQVYLEVQLASQESVDVVGIWWQYPAADISVYVSLVTLANGPQTWFLAQTYEGNTAYTTAVIFADTQTVGGVRVYVSTALELMSGEPIIGIKELQLVSMRGDTDNRALDKPITSSDGNSAGLDAAVDASTVTKWVSATNEEISLTIDLGNRTFVWGLRLLFPANTIASSFVLSVSDDSANFTDVHQYFANEERDVVTLVNITAQYVRVTLRDSDSDYFSVRTFGVYGSPNLALGQDTTAPLSWHHSSYQALDGDDDTFWVSEPLATSAVIKVDLGVLTFIGGGIEILWKFPASVYSLHVSDDGQDWRQLAAFNENVSFTRYDDYFITRYVELRMDQAPVVSSDIVYAIYSFNVIFDTNLAHFKTINASNTIDSGLFDESKAADGDMNTLWMPQQSSDTARIEFDVGADSSISGFTVFWRFPPAAYRVEAYREETDTWFALTNYSTDVGDQQTFSVGAIARIVALEVLGRTEIDEGTLVAMREFELQVPDTTVSIANGRYTTTSDGEDGMVNGNPPSHAVDGNIQGTYWHAGWETHEAWWLVQFDDIYDSVGNTLYHEVARVVIYWRWEPLEYTIEMESYGVWRTVYAEYNLNSSESVDDYLTDVVFLESASQLKVSIKSAGTLIGMREVNVYESMTFSPPPVVLPRDNPCEIEAYHMIDLDNQSFWLSPSGSSDINILLDLGEVYDVQEIEIWMGFKTSSFFVFVSESGYPDIEIKMTSTSVWGFVQMLDDDPIKMRYLRFFITQGYEDPEGGIFGTSVRDIRVWYDNNQAKGTLATSDSTWDFPGASAIDGTNETYWLSQFGASAEELVVDLGSLHNVAGLSVEFGYGAEEIQFSYSVDNSSWTQVAVVESNSKLAISVPSTIHFSARYVKVSMQIPISSIPDPDEPSDLDKYQYVFSVREFEIFEHTGGGGVIGLESLDGTEFSTIVYGQREPGEWMIGSEADIFTNDFGEAAYPEDVGTEVHIAMTFETVLDLPDGVHRYTKVALYRNGAVYGTPYLVQAPIDRLTAANQTRLVFGVRSSAHTSRWNGTDPREGSVLADAHSPFFEGQIRKLSIIRNALTSEEVYGLFETKFGAAERGCHCYDACPAGSNRLFPDVPVPCSGQGVCLRNSDSSSLATATGYCKCNLGFSGDACQSHCSDLSVYGCCEADDDCPSGVECNHTTKACTQ